MALIDLQLLCDSLVREVTLLIKVTWVASVALTVLLTAFLTRLIVRRRQSRDLVTTLRRELRDERQRHVTAEEAHARKLAVYREAAIRQEVFKLFKHGQGAAGEPS